MKKFALIGSACTMKTQEIVYLSQHVKNIVWYYFEKKY